MQVVILAGGLATRMRPTTHTIPKSLIPVMRRPFLDHQLRWLASQGATHVLLAIGYLGQQIRDFAGDGSAWGVSLQYVDEGDHLRGTGGALRLALDQGFLEDSFAVMYGDSFLPAALPPIWEHFMVRPEPALMTLFKNDEKWEKSNACFDGQKVTLYDKKITPKPAEMRYVDYGLSLFRKEAIKQFVPNDIKYDLAEVQKKLSEKGLLLGYEVMERFYEIGSVSGLKDFEAYIQNQINF